MPLWIRVALVAVLALLPGANPRAIEWDRGDLRIETSGSLRTLYTFGKGVHRDRFLAGRLKADDTWRLLVRGRAELEASWRDRLSGQIVYDVEQRTGTGLDTVSFTVGDLIGTRTWLDADRTISSHESGNLRHVLYRAWLRYEDERVEVTVGRQRIPLGRARLWNPSDLFNPIPPLAIEGQQRIGQDAVLARVALREGLWAVGIWAPQDDPDDHRAALRLEMSRPAIDAAAFAGRFARDWVFGGDFATNVRDAAVRGEATYTHLRSGGRVWQVVLSADYEVSIGSGLYLLVEHLMNEARAPQLPDFRIFPLSVLATVQSPLLDRITTRVRNQTGVQVGYDLNPLLRANALAIYDWHGPSVAFFPSLAWSARDDLELSLGVQLFWGPGSRIFFAPLPSVGVVPWTKGRSEYGDAKNLVFVRVDWFF